MGHGGMHSGAGHAERPLTWLRLRLSGSGDSAGTTWIDELLLQEDMLVFSSERWGLRVWIDQSASRLVLIDDRHGTCIQTDLPFDPRAILTEVSALRYDHTPQPTVTSGPLDPCAATEVAERARRRIAIASPQVSEIRIETSPHPLWDDGAYGPLLAELYHVLSADMGRDLAEHLSASTGMPTSIEVHGRQIATCRTGEPEPNHQAPVPDLTDLTPKDRLTYDELLARRVGPAAAPPTEDEAALLEFIEDFQAGYRERRLEDLDRWMDELFTEDVIALGTDGAFPRTREWQSGRSAAREMFERDWRHWGDVRLFPEEAETRIAGDSAWAVLFATVTVCRNDREASQERCLARIAEYASTEWPSRRALYEILADATNVLVQYERGDRFAWPLRITFGLSRIDGRWKIRLVDFSHPARGFRSWRLYEDTESLE